MNRIALCPTLAFVLSSLPHAMVAPRAIGQDPGRSAEAGSRPVLTAGAPKPRTSLDAEALETIRTAAVNGEANAQRVLGIAYQEGRLVPQDHVQSAGWYRKAADQGDATAQLLLGALYDSGLGVPEDHVEAAQWYRKAADQEHAIAQWTIGSMYHRGRGVQQNDAEALKWFRKAAHQGNRGGQVAVGMLYERGQGVAEDPVRALAWYGIAASQGSKVAARFKDRLQERMTAEQIADAQSLGAELSEQISQGESARRANGTDPRPPSKVRSRSVLRAGTPNLRTAFDAEALEAIRAAAVNGVARAQRRLGIAYQEGRVLPRDHAQSALWYRKAADQGDATAQWLLGALYDSGQGVPEDHVEAAQWYRKAADQGLAQAQWTIGSMYQRGRGVAQNDAEAAEWFLKSARQGNRGGQAAVGIMYERGQGVAQDFVRAFAWYDIAASQDSKVAARYKDELKERMTSEQIAEARSLSAALSEQISHDK